MKHIKTVLREMYALPEPIDDLKSVLDLIDLLVAGQIEAKAVDSKLALIMTRYQKPDITKGGNNALHQNR